MSVDGLRGDLNQGNPPPTRLCGNANLKEYALALAGALELAAQIGGRSAFNSLFERGFKRLYTWSYLLAGRNAAEAEALTWDVLSDAAEALARRGKAHPRRGREPLPEDDGRAEPDGAAARSKRVL